MATWIALLRGINVGGNNILPMASLRADLESAGYSNVRTYIQSGNVVFDADAADPARIADTIEQRHGFRVPVLVTTPQDLAEAIKANPFPDAEDKTLHFFFLSGPAQADTDALDALKAPSERYALTDHVFYLHAPDGIGRSKLAARAERHLGVATTARNLRTIEKVLSMA